MRSFDDFFPALVQKVSRAISFGGRPNADVTGRIVGRWAERLEPGTATTTRGLASDEEASTDLEIWCGWIIAPTLAATRTETDFVGHIEQTVAAGPCAGRVFIVDNLNTHQSEGLVLWVAASCGIEADPGVKGKSGVLPSQASRAA